MKKMGGLLNRKKVIVLEKKKRVPKKRETNF